MNEQLKVWNSAETRREIVGSGYHILGILELLNKAIPSNTLKLCIDWFKWLINIAEIEERDKDNATTQSI